MLKIASAAQNTTRQRRGTKEEGRQRWVKLRQKAMKGEQKSTGVKSLETTRDQKKGRKIEMRKKDQRGERRGKRRKKK